jgi:hypothetical protein
LFASAQEVSRNGQDLMPGKCYIEAPDQGFGTGVQCAPEFFLFCRGGSNIRGQPCQHQSSFVPIRQWIV